MSLWSCPSCSKSFARKGDLTRHKLIHTGTKPHVCETCGKGFIQLSGLRTHQNVHSKVKPYKCGIGSCKKAFGDPSSCSRHRKETHRREGAYKCVIIDCGTRIKRRSAFVAHLRKHGLDPSSIDLDAIVSQSNERGVPSGIHLASLDVENKSGHKVGARSVSSPFHGDSTGHHILGNGGETSHFMDKDQWSGDDPFICRRINWSPTHDTLLLGPLEQTVSVGPPNIPHEIYTSHSSNLGNPLCFDGILPTPVDNPLLRSSSVHLPIPESFPKGGSDGPWSSWSSPSSAHASLYTWDFNDDVLSLSLESNVLQESVLYHLV